MPFEGRKTLAAQYVRTKLTENDILTGNWKLIHLVICGLFFDDFHFWAFEKPVGPLCCFLSKSCIKPKVKVSGSSSSSVIQDLPNSQHLLGQPGNTPLFKAFVKTVGPLVCVKSKHCIKQKVTSNWFYRGSLLFYKTSLTLLHSWRISIYVPKVWNR